MIFADFFEVFHDFGWFFATRIRIRNTGTKNTRYLSHFVIFFPKVCLSVFISLFLSKKKKRIIHAEGRVATGESNFCMREYLREI